MKNLMRLSIYFLSFTFLLVSCGPSSEKGNWSDSDLEKCQLEIKKGMYEDGTPEDVDAIFNVLGKTTDEIALCLCEIYEGKYSSFFEADNDDEIDSEEELEMVMLSCLGDMEDLIKLGMEMEDESTSEENDQEQSEEYINEFMESCSGDDSEMTAYCNCMLTQLMLNILLKRWKF